MDTIDNETRAERAAEAAFAYIGEAGPYNLDNIKDAEDLNEEWESILADLVCDLRHLAKQKGLNWDLIESVGESNFIAECEEEETMEAVQ